MKIRSLIKNNKFFTLVSLAFLVWLIFLVISSIIGQRTVIFYDALGQIDVSSDFSSKLPLMRYIVEPFAAIAFIFEKEFRWMFLFLIFYPILRGIYLYLKKKGKFNSEKYRYITYPLADIISFSFQVLTLAVLIIGIYILIGFIVQGYFFVNRYFMVPIQLGFHIGVILIFIKAGYTVLKLLHPKLTLNLSKKAMFRRAKGRRKQQITREAILYIGIGALLISSNIVLISTPFTPHTIVPMLPLEDDEFLFDFHVHTTMSDGWLTPEERVIWYINHGIDGAVFTDHENIRGALIARDYVEKNGLDFIVLIGQEWTDHENDIHINYFGLEEEIVPLESYTPGGPKAMNASDLISYVKVNGGYITVNHYNYDSNPNGGNGVPYSLTQLRNWGIDGFEIVNGDSYGGKYVQLRQFCLSNNLICIGGSDIHINEDLNVFTKLELSDPTNLTIANIFETLKNNTHEVIAIDLYPNVVDFPGDLNDFGFYVLEDFINYLFNIDLCQALSWIIWSVFIYLIFFISYRKIKRVDIKFLKRKIH
ncbi:MAG: PHP domain-containing protein [Candidatus Hodarchaeota archaeon]